MPKLDPPRVWIIYTLWACLVGLVVTRYWSIALHKRVDVLRQRLDSIGALTDDEKKSYPGRLPWMPAWLGVFERAFYCILIGLDVNGAAPFIGVWVAMKQAGGWQVWSKGTMYGHAIFFAGLLGNLMSILFGVVAGLVIRANIMSCITP